jgi:hypothetical protein
MMPDKKGSPALSAEWIREEEKTSISTAGGLIGREKQGELNQAQYQRGYPVRAQAYSFWSGVTRKT